MASLHSEEFKRDAVRIALTSGLTRRQASSDLGIGMSTLNKWIKTYCDSDVVSKAEIDTMLARLQTLSSEHFNASPEEIHWSHVGIL